MVWHGGRYNGFPESSDIIICAETSNIIALIASQSDHAATCSRTSTIASKTDPGRLLSAYVPASCYVVLSIYMTF